MYVDMWLCCLLYACSTEMFDYQQVIFYSVVTSVVAFDRPKLKSKVSPYIPFCSSQSACASRSLGRCGQVSVDFFQSCRNVYVFVCGIACVGRCDINMLFSGACTCAHVMEATMPEILHFHITPRRQTVPSCTNSGTHFTPGL